MTTPEQNRPLVVQIGTRVRLRKQHPCGSDEWTVTRLGADIGLLCAGCGRRVLLARGEFNKRLKSVIASAPMPQSQGDTTP